MTDRRCVVLGAGFSRAVSDRMPLTDELGQLVLDDLAGEGLRGPDSGFSGGYFEAWLSRLAEPQPDLPDHANLHNQAWFSRVTEQVHSVLTTREAEVLSQAPPEWLLRLIRLCHVTRTPLVSFNYDTLVEAAVNAARLYDWEERQFATSWHVVSNLPAEPVRAGTFAQPAANTFRLLKLHGSVDCWWVSGDVTGATMLRSHHRPYFQADQRSPSRPPGLVPFMVPPASTKSRFYANPVTRALWQEAALRLGEATAVDLIGYSLPITDLVTTGMLADRLAGRPVDVRIVNPWPGAPLSTLASFGVSAVPHTSGLSEYVDQWEAQVSSDRAPALTSLAADLPVLVGGHPVDLRAVVAGPGGVPAAEPSSSWTAPHRAREPHEPEPMTVEQLRQRHRPGQPISIQDGDDARPIVDWRIHVTDTGHRDRWAVAVTCWSSAPST